MNEKQVNEVINSIVSNTQSLAMRNQHEYVTLEHLMIVLLREEGVRAVLAKCNVDAGKMQAETEALLRRHVPTFPESERGAVRAPQLTPAFERVIQKTVSHLANSSAERLEFVHFIVPIFDEAEVSQVRAMFNRHGFKREDLVRALSHGSTESGDESAMSEEKLLKFASNLTQKAADGELDPLIGRSLEIERMVQVLGRRRKNNPLLVGDPGVGKTALAEGLAQRIAAGTVPERIRNYKVYSLDLAAMVAGTKYRGDFEERWKALLSLAENRDDIVLFVDEIHNLIGGGSGKGSMDAANLVKPSLASGKLRMIGSTTYDEYRAIFEQDAALARRFQKIDVKEPSSSDAVEILKGLAPHLGEHHLVAFSPEAIEAAVRLSVRYQPDKKLPDKAIDLLDEAASRLRSHHSPAEGDTIGVADVEATLAAITGIPLERATANDRASLSELRPRLESAVFGQKSATDAVVDAVVMAKAGLGDPTKPLGSFLFTGPTGVGKTETAKQLAEVMAMKLLRFDMSEYSESHSVARLVGAPPGYVGYNEGGLLTEQVNKNPHAVLLLDEIEKAHPSIYNMLLQVMDAGRLTDSNGREVDFRHVVIIMTTNAGAVAATKSSIGFLRQDNSHDVNAALANVFPPEFRNRLDAIIQFASLGHEEVSQIVRKFIRNVSAQVAERGVQITVADDAVAWLANAGFDEKMGARPLARAIQENVKKPLAAAMLFGVLENGGLAAFSVNEEGTGLTLDAKPYEPLADTELLPEQVAS